MKRNHSFYKNLLFVFLIFFVLSHVFSQTKPEQKNYKDLFVIIDTSKSMRGVGPTAKKMGMGDISVKVKQSAKKFVSGLQNGDTFTLITFDTYTKFYNTVKIKTPGDKEKLKLVIDNIQFNGLDTYTSRMVKSVEQKVRKLENSFNDASNRNTMVVIMSDGLDDPPSKKSGAEKLKLEEYEKAKRPTGSPMYIYYLHLSPKSITKEQEKRIEKLRSGREGKTTVTQADPSRGKEKIIERAVDKTKKNYQADTDKKENLTKDSGFMAFVKANWWWLLLILLAVIAGIVLLVMMFAGGNKKPKRYMIGYLIYGDKKSNLKESNKVNLSKIKKGFIKIGTSKSDDVYLRGIQFPGIAIYGNKQGGKNGFDISEDDLKKINVVEQKKDGVLSFDDVFEIENFEFTLKLKP